MIIVKTKTWFYCRKNYGNRNERESWENLQKVFGKLIYLGRNVMAIVGFQNCKIKFGFSCFQTTKPIFLASSCWIYFAFLKANALCVNVFFEFGMSVFVLIQKKQWFYLFILKIEFRSTNNFLLFVSMVLICREEFSIENRWSFVLLAKIF